MQSTLIPVNSLNVRGVSDNLKTVHKDRLRSPVLEASLRRKELCFCLGVNGTSGKAEERGRGESIWEHEKHCWEEISLLRVSQNTLSSVRAMLPDRCPRAGSRLEGARRRPGMGSKREVWVAEEAEENTSQQVLAQS